jgi:CDP-glycerol glycerophosphotransferase (TagB/SpsB family)
MYKFLIYIAHSYSLPIGRPLEQEIRKRGYQVKWFSELEYPKKSFTSGDNLLNTIQEVVKYKPDIVLVATDSVASFIPGIKVQIFHGFLVNKWSFERGHFRIRGFYDLYCTQGPSTTQPFLGLKEKHKYFDVVETGWSKVDPLFPIENKESSDRPVIMISSTFTARLSLAKNEDVVNEIKRMSKLGKWQFLCVLHPKMDQDIVEKFKLLENENFIYYDTTDLVPIFRKADVMLSDTTSAIPEFILQEKPVVTFRNNKPDNYLINVIEVEEIEKAIEKALTRPDQIIKNIKNYIQNTHPYSDGKSSGRVIDAAIHFLKTKKVKRKPLNLVRKIKTRIKLKYYKL